ncbi:MAG: UDP-3-O-(3-hydroxymyristoyl)glucosamine N-acyltransferase [Verrucomicrobiota bacterium]|nr:UDP-3-O-(3-hydroxymyristoyl)glucosamine N-acyltransferase [Verrucomicrobiota bacterium]
MRNDASVTLTDILALCGPNVLGVVGPKRRSLSGPAAINEARDARAITFCGKTGPQAARLILKTRAGIVFCKPEAVTPDLKRSLRGKTLVTVADPRLAFLRVVKKFFGSPPPRGRHPTAVIESGAKVHQDTYLGPFCYVAAGCRIGQGTVIHGHVHIAAGTRIGRNVVIQAGTVIGMDGFGYQQNKKGEWEKFPHLGGVVIEDDVEIGSNTCIDRGALGDTRIRRGARVDNLVHVAHNVRIGRHSLVIANAMLGGGARIGDYVWVAPSATLREHVKVGRDAFVGLGSVVVKNVPRQTLVMGAPARTIRKTEPIRLMPKRRKPR